MIFEAIYSMDLNKKLRLSEVMYELLLIDPSYFADFKFFPNTFLKEKI